MIYVPGVIGAVLVVAFMVELLRRRRLSEKYAALWLGVGVVVVILAVVPDVLDTLARWCGVKTPSNLLFFLGSITLLLVCVHLSCEANRLEEETRTLAEEIALLRADVEERTKTPDAHA